MKRIAAVALVVLACGPPPPEVPADRPLLRITSSWIPVTREADDLRRAAPATIVVFRSSHEFVELHSWLIQQPDETLYISSAHPYVVAVGRWSKDDDEIKVVREKVARKTGARTGTDPFCEKKDLTFRIVANTVAGNTGEAQPGTYSPITRLVAPGFESFVTEAKRSGTRCEPEPD